MIGLGRRANPNPCCSKASLLAEQREHQTECLPWRFCWAFSCPLVKLAAAASLGCSNGSARAISQFRCARPSKGSAMNPTGIELRLQAMADLKLRQLNLEVIVLPPLLPREGIREPGFRRAKPSYSNDEKIWSGRRGSNPRPRPWQGNPRGMRRFALA